MKTIVSGLKNIIGFFKFAIRIINTILHNTTRVIKYIGAVVPKIFAFILTLPPYIQIFAQLTIGIAIAFLLLGRNSGKSDTK